MENQKFSNEELHNVVALLNQYWCTIPENSKPTYGGFNKILPVHENSEKLEKLDKNNDGLLVLANWDTDQRGLSTFSFIATIFNLLSGVKLSGVLEDDNTKDRNSLKIIGWRLFNAD